MRQDHLMVELRIQKQKSWNGSAWTEVNDIPTVLYRISAFGTSTADLLLPQEQRITQQLIIRKVIVGMEQIGQMDQMLNTPRSYQMGLGTSTAGMIVGGYIQSPASMVGNTEIWNGSAWTEVNDLNTARRSGGASKIGSTSEGIVLEVQLHLLQVKQKSYNGSSWSETADLATARVGITRRSWNWFISIMFWW